MSAIEHRNWQEVDEPQIYGEKGDQLNELERAETGLLPRDLRHFQRATQVPGRTAAGDDLDQAVDHRPRQPKRVAGGFGNETNR